MQRLIILALGLVMSLGASAQSLKKYFISNSGCSVYMFCNPGTFGLSYSEDSSAVYTGECNNADVPYSVICVKLKVATTNLNTAEELLEQYMDYLKTSFKITKSAGYGKGHKLKNSDRTRGMIDYWEDDEQFNWKVKGWTDGNYVCVLCASSKTELPEAKINVFLDGLGLPGI